MNFNKILRNASQYIKKFAVLDNELNINIYENLQ